MKFLRKKWDFFAAVLLLLLHVLLLTGFIRANFLTVDEPVHLVGGLEILQNGGHCINPESGVIPQILGAFPICKDIPMPPESTMEKQRMASYEYSRWILFSKSKQDIETLILKSRLGASFFSVLCGWFIFLIARGICGKIPALTVLGFYIILPLFLSNGALLTADMAVSAFFVSSLYLIWKLLRRMTLCILILCAFSLTLLILSKMSALLIGPVFILLAVIRIASRSPVRLRFPFCPFRIFRGRMEKTLLLCGAGVFLAVFIWGGIWIAYGFRYEFPPLPAEAMVVRDYKASLRTQGVAAEVMKFLGNQKLLPQPYVYGFLHMYFHSQSRWSFLDGRESNAGHALFFPKVFLYKTPPPVILAFLLVFWAFYRNRKSVYGRKRMAQFLPYLIFTAVFTACALSSNLNIGYRHLMPGIAAFLPLCALPFRELGRMRFPYRLLPVALLLWSAVESFSIYPHSLAYFSSLFGGPERAYTHVVDSSLDWGQDIRNIKAELEKNEIPTDGTQNIYLLYFGSVSPYLSNVKIKNIDFSPSGKATDYLYEFEPGIYLISATYLRGFAADPSADRVLGRSDILATCHEVFYAAYDARNVGKPLPSLDSERSLDNICREYQYLRFELLRRHLGRRTPDFHVNYSIYGYLLGTDELKAVLKDLQR